MLVRLSKQFLETFGNYLDSEQEFQIVYIKEIDSDNSYYLVKAKVRKCAENFLSISRNIERPYISEHFPGFPEGGRKIYGYIWVEGTQIVEEIVNGSNELFASVLMKPTEAW